jgi:hypothetical protein
MIGFIGTSVKISLNIINIELLPIYIIYSSLLHTHYVSHFPLIVSWQQISTQKLSFQITLKSSWSSSPLLILSLKFAVWLESPDPNSKLKSGPVLSTELPKSQPESESVSDLLYDWRFTACQFVLAIRSLRLTTNNVSDWTLEVIRLM